MTIIQAILLGLVQGLTEFIPISSSAHLIIIPWLFKWTDPALTSLSFDVALHLGTLIAVLWFFGRDWLRLIRAWFLSIKERKIAGNPDRRLAWLILLGCIPGGIAGVLAESKIDELFHQANVPISKNAILVLAIIIILLAILLYIVERVAKHSREMNSLTLKDAAIIGLAQALAIFPGVSRSGSTITAGLAIGLKREDAARFSFLLGAPIIAGAGAKSLWDLIQASQAGSGMAGSELILFPIGMVVAAISGYFCIKFLLNFLQKHSMDAFVYYRWALAALIVVVALVRG
ncbi:MAG: undecaprenyl-diphosphatase UppP [Anaerolineaceae bacterium]